MSDFGEPLTIKRDPMPDGWCFDVIDANGNTIQVGEDECMRIVACVNALAGIADPAEQVRRWKAWDVWLDRHASLISAFADLPDDEIARLAAEWTPDE